MRERTIFDSTLTVSLAMLKHNQHRNQPACHHARHLILLHLPGPTIEWIDD